MKYFKLNLKGQFWIENPLFGYLLGWIQHYNPNRYWLMRSKVIDPLYSNKLKKMWFLYKLKKMEAFNNSSMGTNFNSGAKFGSVPILPHGLNGIIIGHDAIIGKNVYIHHQVTIAHGNVVIGDNVFIGAGVKILPNVTIGENVKIGANCVIVENIPPNVTVVLNKPRIIKKTD